LLGRGVIDFYQKDCGKKPNNWYYRETCPECQLSKPRGHICCGVGFCHCSKNSFLLTKEDKNEAIEIINQELEKKQVGKRTETYHLKD
jgi:hypothetical protein